MDSIRPGGADSGAGAATFDAVEAAFLAWTLVLLALGVRTVHGWTWARSLAALALAAAPIALLVGALEIRDRLGGLA